MLESFTNENTVLRTANRLRIQTSTWRKIGDYRTSASIEGDAGLRGDDHWKCKTLVSTIPGLQKPIVANQPFHETPMHCLAANFLGTSSC